MHKAALRAQASGEVTASWAGRLKRGERCCRSGRLRFAAAASLAPLPVHLSTHCTQNKTLRTRGTARLFCFAQARSLGRSPVHACPASASKIWKWRQRLSIGARWHKAVFRAAGPCTATGATRLRAFKRAARKCRARHHLACASRRCRYIAKCSLWDRWSRAGATTPNSAPWAAAGRRQAPEGREAGRHATRCAGSWTHNEVTGCCVGCSGVTELLKSTIFTDSKRYKGKAGGPRQQSSHACNKPGPATQGGTGDGAPLCMGPPQHLCLPAARGSQITATLLSPPP